ncbi:MAG: hypothetical protein AAGH81_03575, partial [Bacteroidota bacterium]
GKKARTIDKVYGSGFGFIIGYSMGSKSKYQTMKSSQNIQKGSGTKKIKKENTLDITSKSIF